MIIFAHMYGKQSQHSLLEGNTGSNMQAIDKRQLTLLMWFATLVVRDYPPWLLFTTFVDSVGYPWYNLQKTCKQ